MQKSICHLIIKVGQQNILNKIVEQLVEQIRKHDTLNKISRTISRTKSFKRYNK